jgi:hypothetical protein
LDALLPVTVKILKENLQTRLLGAFNAGMGLMMLIG